MLAVRLVGDSRDRPGQRVGGEWNFGERRGVHLDRVVCPRGKPLDFDGGGRRLRRGSSGEPCRGARSPTLGGHDRGAGPVSPEETLLLNLSIGGGLPPFRLVVNASDNESWNRTLPTDGVNRCVLPTHANQSLKIDVSLTDLLGGVVRANLSVVLTSPPDPATPPTPPAPPPVAPPPATPVASGDSTNATPVDLAGLLAVVLVPVGVARGPPASSASARSTRSSRCHRSRS